MAMQYGIDYDVLLRADMSDADMVMAGTLIFNGNCSYVFNDSDHTKRWRLDATDEMPTMCGGQEHNVTWCRREAYELTYSPWQAKHIAGYSYYLNTWGIQLLNLHADTKDQLDLLIRCLWLALEDHASNDTSIIGAHTKPTMRYNYSAALVLHTDRWYNREDSDVLYDIEEYGYESEDDDADFNLGCGPDRINFYDDKFGSCISSVDGTAYACEWYATGYGSTILDILLDCNESREHNGVMITSNFGNPDGETYAVISAIRDSVEELAKYGWLVVANEDWATNPNEREHYISSVFVTRKTELGSEQLITSAPQVTPQLVLELREAA